MNDPFFPYHSKLNIYFKKEIRKSCNIIYATVLKIHDHIFKHFWENCFFFPFFAVGIFCGFFLPAYYLKSALEFKILFKCVLE